MCNTFSKSPGWQLGVLGSHDRAVLLSREHDAPTQWMDVGIFLQTVMLLFRAERMDTCPQIAWAEYHETVAEVIEPSNNLVLACGMSIGFADPDVPRVSMPRAQLSDAVSFVT